MNPLKPLFILISMLCLMACQEKSTDQKAVNQTQASNPDEASQETSDQTLQFTLKNIKGDDVQATDFRGKWLVLNYWATWCAPCRDEMPELVKFQKNNPDVQVLGIAYEDSPVEKLQSFVKDFNINYPILTIDVYNPPAFAEEGGLGLPTTIVYNKDGTKHKKHMGPIDYDGLMELIQ